jgi:hypothetical protein
MGSDHAERACRQGLARQDRRSGCRPSQFHGRIWKDVRGADLPGEELRKGTYTVDIPALPAGNYLFICTIHPDAMTGTLTIK